MTLLTIKQTVEKYPFLTLPGLQWHVYNRNKNGLSKAIIKMGKRVYIDDEAFPAWIESKREG